MGLETMSGPIAVDKGRFVAASRNSKEKRESRKRKKTFQGTWSVGLGQVASSSATQGHWLEDGKVRFQVVDVDRCRLSRRKTVRKVRRR